VKAAIQFSDLEAFYLQDEEGEKGQERVGNIRELVNAAEGYREAHADQGVAGYLDHVALVTSADDEDTVADQVRLMTVHASKGLEFPVVFIIALEHGIFPVVRGKAKEVMDLEEERRLMYVGITRAKEELYLSFARYRSLYGQSNPTEPSQFLAEIPKHCLRERDASGRRPAPQPPTTRRFGRGGGPGGRRPGRDADGPPPAEAPGDDDAPVAFDSDPWKAGEAVVHEVFGRGTVLGLKGSPGNRVVAIHFAKVGIKELVCSLAAAKLRRAEHPSRFTLPPLAAAAARLASAP
jgi:DNA helicase-2/ATP-dependent DNA helicase PcrA